MAAESSADHSCLCQRKKDSVKDRNKYVYPKKKLCLNEWPVSLAVLCVILLATFCCKLVLITRPGRLNTAVCTLGVCSDEVTYS